MKTVELGNVVNIIRNKLQNLVAIQSYAELDDKLWNKVPYATYFTFTAGNTFLDYDNKLHPFAAAGNIEIRRYGDASTMQILYDANSKIFIRTSLAGSEKLWSSWVKI